MDIKASYHNLESTPWSKVMQLNERKWSAPYSVHLPLHPPHSETFIYMDSALNVYTLPVPSKMESKDVMRRKHVGETLELMIVQLAFDQAPFIPDFRLSTLELAEGRFPIVKAFYSAWDLLYELEFFSSQIDNKQNVLWLKVSVKNDSLESREAHVRAKVNFQLESSLFDYHYVPFYWDNTKWLKDDSVSYNNGELCRNGQFIGLIKDRTFAMEWEESFSFNDDDYNKLFGCSTPYFVQPAMRLKEAENLLHFHGELEPGEKKSFTLALLAEPQQAKDEHVSLLKKTTYKNARQDMLDEFKSITNQHEIAQLKLSYDNIDNAFTAMQICNQQMLIDFDDTTGLQPCQGGSGERFYVWVWEAMCMLRPMLQLGHFAEVKKVIDFIFSLQDGGYPPIGEFSSLEGAIGTTGPRWMNATGSALVLAADYCNYSQDEKFLQEYLPKMLRAADWIIGEIKATRKLNPDGSRPPVYGLMPFGCSTDGDEGYIVSFSDGYSYFGLNELRKLLKKTGHQRFKEIDDEIKQYRNDIDAAINYMRSDNGHIDRKIVLYEGKGHIAHKFNSLCGIQMLCLCGALSANDERFKVHIDFCEKNIHDGFFVSPMDRDIEYIGTGEHVWQNVYLQTGNWKKAFSTLQTCLKYGMTQATFLVQERFSKTDSAYTPWQPNSSGNGRMLEMICNQFYFEYKDIDFGFTITFFGGMPPNWFDQEMSLKRLFTSEGRISIETNDLQLKITCENFNLKDRIIRFPEYLKVKIAPEVAEDLGKGFFKVISTNPCLKARAIHG